MTKQFDDCRHHTNEDDDSDDEREILLDKWLASEEVAQQRKTDNPDDSACDVVDGKSSVGHLADTGHKRGKRPHNGHEPRQNDGLSTVPFVERMRLLDMFPLDEAFESTSQYLVANVPPNTVVDGVAGDRRNDQ